VALLGGILPALLATTTAVLLSATYHPALHTLRVTNLSTWSPDHLRVVAIAVGGLVDLLTRQGVRAAPPRPRPQPRQTRRRRDRVPSRPRRRHRSIRRAFDLTCRSSSRADTGWEVETVVGTTQLRDPDSGLSGPDRPDAFSPSSTRHALTATLHRCKRSSPNYDSLGTRPSRAS